MPTASWIHQKQLQKRAGKAALGSKAKAHLLVQASTTWGSEGIWHEPAAQAGTFENSKPAGRD